MKSPFILALLAILSLNTSQAADPIMIDGIAAYVNDAAIFQGDVLRARRPIEAELRRNLSGPKLQMELRTSYLQVLDTLINNKLIVSAFTEEGGSLPDKAIDDRITDLVQARYKGDSKLLQEDLLKQGMTMGQLRDQQRESIIVRSMRSRTLQGRVKVSPKLVRASYEEEKTRFTTDSSVHIRMIVLDIPDPESRVSQEQKAKNILDQLKKGDDFASLARVVSQGFYAKKGGDWGSIEPKELRKEIGDAVDLLKKGEVSPIVDTGDQLYIIKLEGRTAAGFEPFEDVQAALESRLYKKEEARLYAVWLKTMRADAYIDIIPITSFR